MKYAKTEKPQGNKTIFRFMWILKEICTLFCRYFKALSKADRTQGGMGLVH